MNTQPLCTAGHSHEVPSGAILSMINDIRGLLGHVPCHPEPSSLMDTFTTFGGHECRNTIHSCSLPFSPLPYTLTSLSLLLWTSRSWAQFRWVYPGNGEALPLLLPKPLSSSSSPPPSPPTLLTLSSLMSSPFLHLPALPSPSLGGNAAGKSVPFQQFIKPIQ